MAGEWVVPTVSGVIALVGIGVGVWNTYRGQEHQRAMAAEEREAVRIATDQQRQDDLDDARAQWLRDRRADAYVELVRIAQQVKNFVGAPVGVSAEKIDTLLRQIETTLAIVTVYGSPQVLHELLGWRITLTMALRETLKDATSGEAKRWQGEMEKMIDRMTEAVRADFEV